MINLVRLETTQPSRSYASITERRTEASSEYDLRAVGDRFQIEDLLNATK